MYKNAFLLVVVMVAITSCNLYPGSESSTEDLDVIITQKGPEADLSGMKTYAISSTVKPISNDPNSSPDFEVSPEMENVIIQTVEANMAGYGWQLVDSTENPDLAMDLGATVTQNTNVYGSYPGYGWGYPGYGWYYPWWGYTTVSSYKVGSVIMAGLDINNVDSINMNIPVFWIGMVQGPAIGNVDDPLSRVQRDINQAFEQSPYLNRN